MKTKVVNAKYKNQACEPVTVELPEVMEDLLNMDATKVIAWVTKGILLETQAKQRAALMPHTPRVKKEALYKEAFNLCTPEEIMSLGGDYDKLQALLQSKVELLKKQKASA